MGRAYTTNGLILNNNSSGTLINYIGVNSNLNFIRDVDTITNGTVTTGTFSTIIGAGGSTSIDVVTTSSDQTIFVQLQAVGYNNSAGTSTNAGWIGFAAAGIMQGSVLCSGIYHPSYTGSIAPVTSTMTNLYVIADPGTYTLTGRARATAGTLILDQVDFFVATLGR